MSIWGSRHSIRTTVVEESVEVRFEVGLNLSCLKTPPLSYRATARLEVTITSVTFDHLPFRLTLKVQSPGLGGGYTRVKTIARNTCGFGAGVRPQLEHPHQVRADVWI